jgi:hypothetical protein
MTSALTRSRQEADITLRPADDVDAKRSPNHVPGLKAPGEGRRTPQ